MRSEQSVSREPGAAGALTPSADSRAQDFQIRVPAPDYRAMRFILLRPWGPKNFWGLDFFVWHIPLLKTTLALDALIVWWLS